MADQPDALREVTRRFLAAYAPTTTENLGLWTGFGRARAKKMLAALGDDAIELEIEGEPAWALAADVEEIASVDPPDTARLLPAFDPWVVGTAPDGAGNSATKASWASSRFPRGRFAAERAIGIFLLTDQSVIA